MRGRSGVFPFQILCLYPHQTLTPSLLPGSGTSTPLLGVFFCSSWWMVCNFMFRSSCCAPARVVTLWIGPLRGCPVYVPTSHLTTHCSPYRSKRGSSWAIRLFRCCSVWASCCVSWASCCSGGEGEKEGNGYSASAAPQLPTKQDFCKTHLTAMIPSCLPLLGEQEPHFSPAAQGGNGDAATRLPTPCLQSQ